MVFGSGAAVMTMGMPEKNEPELTPEELEEQDAEQLPDREAMSLLDLNAAAPVNAAVALNALSDGSIAIAAATQTADITQSN
jgi:mannose/fructose-specific phosphotransferase system component IIA